MNPPDNRLTFSQDLIIGSELIGVLTDKLTRSERSAKRAVEESGAAGVRLRT